MTQCDLNEEVARVTGENVATVDRIGFHLADPLDVNFDPEPRRPFIYDWDSGEVVDWPD